MEKIITYIKNNKKEIINGVILILYTLFMGILILRHETWRDESQGYLLCRDLSFPDLLKQLKYEGHPFLWYSLIYPFVKLGFGIKSLNIITYVLGILSVSIIINKCKLPLITKIAFILTYPFIYLYVVVARNYSVVLLLGMLICMLDKNKKSHPIIYAMLLGLLANTHIMMVGFVAIITLTFYVNELIFKRKYNSKTENKNLLIGLIIVAFSGVLLLLQLKGAGASPVIEKSDQAKNWLNLIFILPKSLMEETTPNLILGFICTVVLIIPILIVDKKKVIIYIASMLFQSLLSIYIYGYINMHITATVIVVVIYSIWTTYDEITDKKIRRIYEALTMTVMLIIAGLSMIYSCKVIKLDLEENYSSAYELSEYINVNTPEDAIFIDFYDAQCSSIIPYTNNRKYWNIVIENYYTYVTWNEDRLQRKNLNEVISIIKEKFQGQKVYYIKVKYSSVDKTIIENLEKEFNVKELYETENSYIMDEIFTLYEINL